MPRSYIYIKRGIHSQFLSVKNGGRSQRWQRSQALDSKGAHSIKKQYDLATMHIILDSKPNFINEDEGHKHGQGENKCPKNRFQSFEFCTGTPTFAHTQVSLRSWEVTCRFSTCRSPLYRNDFPRLPASAFPVMQPTHTTGHSRFHDYERGDGSAAVVHCLLL